MKKLLIIPAVIGLLVVPSVVIAGRSNKNASFDSNDLQSQDIGSISSDSGHESNESQIDDSQSEIEDNSQSEFDDHSQEDNYNPASQTISVEEARANAQAIFPDKTIKNVETEYENGVIIYSVRFTDGSRVDISSADGSVLKTESENHSENEDQSSGHSSDDS